jgi:hypothetical protein
MLEESGKRAIKEAEMHHAKRVVYQSRPYLLRHHEGEEKVYGPFEPGSEPTLAMATADREVEDPTLISEVRRLAAVSPPLPFNAEGQAGVPSA